jgi:hypothetical protein
MWLMTDYSPELAALDLQTFPPLEQLAERLGGDVQIEKLPIPGDMPDWMLGSFWTRTGTRTSGFACRSLVIVDCVVSDVFRDLAGGLRDEPWAPEELEAFDVGLGLVVSMANCVKGSGHTIRKLNCASRQILETSLKGIYHLH